MQQAAVQTSHPSEAYQRVPRPVALMSDEYDVGAVDVWHHHERSQLIYACTGVMSVATRSGSYVVPPQRAVWIPAGMDHEVHFRSRVSLRTLYVRPDARAELPTACRVIAVPNLLKELILEAASLPLAYDIEGRDGRVMELILDEIIAVPCAHLSVPMPRSPRLVRLCSRLLDEPATQEVIDSLAASAGFSRRTFTRLFRKETGMGFGEWRVHVRMLEAISRMAAGTPITRVAFEVGYSSQSAFTATFRRIFGTTPTDYLSRL